MLFIGKNLGNALKWLVFGSEGGILRNEKIERQCREKDVELCLVLTAGIQMSILCLSAAPDTRVAYNISLFSVWRAACEQDRYSLLNFKYVFVRLAAWSLFFLFRVTVQVEDPYFPKARH